MSSDSSHIKNLKTRARHSSYELLGEPLTETSPGFCKVTCSLQALYIDEKDCYDLYWPIVGGELNTSGKSITAVLADLEALWTKAIETFLGIPLKEIEKYR